MHFVQLVEAAARPESGAILLGMLGNDQKLYRFEIGAGCAALVIAALAAELGKLNAPDTDQQFILAKGITTAVSDQRAPMLLLALESGAELPLVLQGGDLNELIGELQSLSKTIAPGATH